METAEPGYNNVCNTAEEGGVRCSGENGDAQTLAYTPRTTNQPSSPT